MGVGVGPPGWKTKTDERTHLLPKPSDEENGEYLDLDGKTPGWRLILDEFIILTKDSVPVILAYILQNSLQTISVVIVGQASPEDLASAAFAYMFAMCTAWLIALGGTTAMDTLGSASFTGSSDPHDLGVILQRAFIVLGLFYIPVCILWIFSEPLFLALGQDPQISRDSSRFLMCLIPGGLGYIYLEAMKKYLQAQGMKICHFLEMFANFSRNHETWHLCPTHRLSRQCWPQLPILLYPQIRPSRSPHCNRHLLLARILPPLDIHPLRPRLARMGRMVPKMPLKHGRLC